MHPDVFIGLVNVELMYLITNCHPDRIIHVHCPTKFPRKNHSLLSWFCTCILLVILFIYLFIFACKSTSLVSLSKGRWPVPNGLYLFILYLHLFKVKNRLLAINTIISVNILWKRYDCNFVNLAFSMFCSNPNEKA